MQHGRSSCSGKSWRRGNMTEFEMLLACYRSGQMSERQWQEHLRNGEFRRWVEEAAMPEKLIVVRESEWRQMRRALAKCAEGWGNAVEFDLLPRRYHAAATCLRDEALSALSHPAPDTKGPYEARFVDGGMPSGCCEYGVISISEGR